MSCGLGQFYLWKSHRPRLFLRPKLCRLWLCLLPSWPPFLSWVLLQNLYKERGSKGPLQFRERVRGRTFWLLVCALQK